MTNVFLWLVHRTPATALHFLFYWLHDSMTGLSSSGISTGQNSRKPKLWWALTHHKGKTSHSSLSLNIIVSNLRVSISWICKNNVRFQPWCGVIQTCHLFHVFQQLCVNCKWNWSAGEQSPKICKLSDLSDSGIQHQTLQSWDPSHFSVGSWVHESQSISRWEESSDSNLPPIPCLSTTKCGKCKTHPVSRSCKIMTRSGKIMKTTPARWYKDLDVHLTRDVAMMTFL